MESDKPRMGVLIVAALYALMGLLAMLVCVSFSLSADLVTIIGAGLGLITGAVLMGAGLIGAAITVSR